MSSAKLIAMAALAALMTTSGCVAEEHSARSGVAAAFREAATNSLHREDPGSQLASGSSRDQVAEGGETVTGGMICVTEDGAPYESESC